MLRDFIAYVFYAILSVMVFAILVLTSLGMVLWNIGEAISNSWNGKKFFKELKESILNLWTSKEKKKRCR